MKYNKQTICNMFEAYIENDTLFTQEDEAAVPGASLLLSIYEHAVSTALCIRLSAHGLFCKTCAGKKRRLLLAEKVIKTGFLPPAPGCENEIMAVLFEEDAKAVNTMHEYVSMRGWVISGIVIAASLLSVYFNVNFGIIASIQGDSYTLPLGITIGAIITVYGALFIGSHLTAICKKLGLN